ncbi:hypothetical protein [Halorarum salinum]|uniref:Nickel/cobalt efflux system n=1 Tax=Halorarum salinum TaxID=2743089 RepID=A0A7D5QAQ7_9EURY|nr:hypothetical protein [Halobaculum salinum]QLG61639.1 hypothetical protein HUG12_07830 [Halobaculum salinum]
MLHDVAPGLLLGALALGAVHGAEPGHGWPIAAAYAFDRANAWLAGLVAGLVIGVGHLLSSLAVVGAFFLLKAQLDLDGLTEPLTVAGVPVGSPIGVVAGVLLILLGIREYRGGGHSHSHEEGNGDSHSHGDDHGRPHSHGTDHAHHHEGDGSTAGRLHEDVAFATPDGHAHGGSRGHSHDNSHGGTYGHSHDEDGRSHEHGIAHDHDAHDGGVLARLAAALPLVGGDGGHAHDHGSPSAEDGLYGIAVSAFVLGFAHEEEFEIIAICAGSDHCLGLMLAYALTVVAVITALTLALVAGYERFEDRMERYAEHFPTVSAVVLCAMGVGFLVGLF